MRVYYVYYHRRGEGETPFNQMRTTVRARNAEDAVEKAKRELGKGWTIEKAGRA